MFVCVYTCIFSRDFCTPQCRKTWLQRGLYPRCLKHMQLEFLVELGYLTDLTYHTPFSQPLSTRGIVEGDIYAAPAVYDPEVLTTSDHQYTHWATPCILLWTWRGCFENRFGTDSCWAALSERHSNLPELTRPFVVVGITLASETHSVYPILLGQRVQREVVWFRVSSLKSMGCTPLCAVYSHIPFGVPSVSLYS